MIGGLLDVTGSEASHSEDERPPNDYKEIDIFPTIEDIEDLRPYIRKNIIDGKVNRGSDRNATLVPVLSESRSRSHRKTHSALLQVETYSSQVLMTTDSTTSIFNFVCCGKISSQR